jgi:hypothetical protein
MIAVRLAEARDELAFGGKAVQLGAAVRAGLPVPAGFALAADLVETVARGLPAGHVQLAAVCARLTTPLAVRSSGVGEDLGHHKLRRPARHGSQRPGHPGGDRGRRGSVALGLV